MLKVAIIGASGYTGGELLRLLSRHPHVDIIAATSEKSSGKPLSQIFPNLKNFFNLTFQPLDPKKLSEEADFIFTALPHGRSIGPVAEFVKHGKRVVDLSADFRLKDPSLYEKWYGGKHTDIALLKDAVYGLPELYRDKIKDSFLVANPGCYPTASILALAPLMKCELTKSGLMKSELMRGGLEIRGQIYIDAKSGISGAGRSPALSYHFPEVHEGLEAYKVGTHRHIPEIEQILSEIAGVNIQVCFVPHLTPVNRGLLSTVYVPLSSHAGLEDISGLYQKFYSNEPFIRVLDPGLQPNIRDVRGANFCDIGLALDSRNNCLIITAVIDNLVKGAAGTAVQNMNIMMGFGETTGLMHPGLFP